MAQPPLDSDYEMYAFDDCSPTSPNASVFVKVEVDPEVIVPSKSSFLRQLHSTVNDHLKQNITGALKLKVLFTTDGQVCLREMGFHGMDPVNYQAVVRFKSHFPQVDSFNPGKQKMVPQECIGIVLLALDQGTITSYRIANMSFVEN